MLIKCKDSRVIFNPTTLQLGQILILKADFNLQKQNAELRHVFRKNGGGAGNDSRHVPLTSRFR